MRHTPFKSVEEVFDAIDNILKDVVSNVARSQLSSGYDIVTHRFSGFPCSGSQLTKEERRRFQIQASSLVLPLLPFPIDQVLVPSEAKTLHLYEARYIALLEESLFRKNKLFVHFVLDPVASSGTSPETSFAARYGCLVIIEKVEQLEIGALISIRGVGRVKLLEFKQLVASSLMEMGLNQKFGPHSMRHPKLSKNLDKETRKVQSLERELLLAKCLVEEEVDVSNSNELHEMFRLLERKIGMVDRRIADIEPSSSNMVASLKQTIDGPHRGKGKQPL
ncbi:UNVERIFIED_CONTAM: hypothetical protein Sangu_2256300 [Sesamum angustifolium]|uniref:Lon N-terminal domain-containing protein n=1 Tax=Sesamum angustifolium TaxID=2727405 RepID=A0AAW2L5A1_9LAMI